MMSEVFTQAYIRLCVLTNSGLCPSIFASILGPLTGLFALRVTVREGPLLDPTVYCIYMVGSTEL